jgi:hypothetical protein
MEGGMVTKEHMANAPADFLRLIPKDLISAPAIRAYKKALGRLDQLLFLDQFGELSVDRDAFIALARDRSLVPADIADVMMLETTKHIGRRLKVRKNGAQVSWIDSAKHGLPIAPLSLANFQEFTGDGFATVKDIEKFIYRALPDVPKFWTRSDSQAIRSDIIKGALLNRSYWDCLVAHLGFWAALVLIGSHVVFFALLGVSWQVALAWAIVYSGVATAYVLLQCAANPDWN